MKCISEIKKVKHNLEIDIEENIKAEELAGGFDDCWINEMKLKQDILGELNKIIATYEFIVEQDNK